MMKFTLEPKPPFDFELMASLYSRFPTQCVDLYEMGVYKRAFRIKDEIHLVAVESVGTVEKPKLVVEVEPPVPQKLIEQKVKWMLGTEDDLSPFYNLALKDKKFASVIKSLYGLRAPRTPTFFEALIIAITEQQIALPAALKLRKKLVGKYGESTKIDGVDYFAFPEPQDLAGARPEEMRELGLSTRKAEYIIGAAQKVARGEVDLEEMKDWEPERILAILTKIRGIGPWTVEYMMCRGMGRYEALPANDLGLRVSLTQFLGRRERVTEEEARKFLEPFGQYRGYAAFYLIYTYAFGRYPQERLL